MKVYSEFLCLNFLTNGIIFTNHQVADCVRFSPKPFLLFVSPMETKIFARLDPPPLRFPRGHAAYAPQFSCNIIPRILPLDFFPVRRVSRCPSAYPGIVTTFRIPFPLDLLRSPALQSPARILPLLMSRLPVAAFRLILRLLSSFMTAFSIPQLATEKPAPPALLSSRACL